MKQQAIDCPSINLDRVAIIRLIGGKQVASSCDEMRSDRIDDLSASSTRRLSHKHSHTHREKLADKPKGRKMFFRPRRLFGSRSK